MAKLPSEADLLGHNPMSASGGAPSTARKPYPVSTGQSAQGLAALADALGGVSQEVAVVELRKQEHANDVRVEDAYNKLRDQQLDMTYGQDGFVQKKGADALKPDVQKTYQERFDGKARAIEDSLQTPQQKERFRLRAGIAASSFQGDLMRHIAHQDDVYQAGVYKATVDGETRQAMASWNDPTSVQLSLERTQNAVSREADRMGFKQDDPQRQQMLLHSASGIHAAVITQALQANDSSYAQKYYEANKNSIDPTVVKTLGHQVAQGVQKDLANTYQTEFLAQRDSRQGLEGLFAKVQGDKTLDEDRRNILAGRIQTRAETLELRAARDEDRKTRLVQRGIDGVNKLTLAGFEPTTESMMPLVAAAKGTDLEPQVNQMIAVANVTRAFRLALPQQQEATITSLEAAVRKDPTKFDVTVVDRFKKIYANQRQEIKNDPVSFAVRQGLIDDKEPAAQPLDLKQPEAMGEQLRARFDLARTMSSKYQAPVKPLTKEEVDGLAAGLRGGTVEQRSAYIGKLVQAAGNDFDGYKAMMAQLAPDDPVTAHAGIMAGRGRISTDAGFDAAPGRATNVSERILRGQAILHPDRKTDGSPEQGKLWPMPKDEELSKTFVSYERDAFAGRAETRNGFMQTAKALYAEASVTAGDSSGVLDSSRWEESMKLATGGIERWNGKSLVMPWGFSKGQFKDELYRRIDDVVDTGRLNENLDRAKLRDMPLESVGDGRFMFRAGDGLLVDKKGQPIVLDFNVSPAFRSSGYKMKPSEPAGPTPEFDVAGNTLNAIGAGLARARDAVRMEYDNNLPGGGPAKK